MSASKIVSESETGGCCAPLLRGRERSGVRLHPFARRDPHTVLLCDGVVSGPACRQVGHGIVRCAHGAEVGSVLPALITQNVRHIGVQADDLAGTFIDLVQSLLLFRVDLPLLRPPFVGVGHPGEVVEIFLGPHRVRGREYQLAALLTGRRRVDEDVQAADLATVDPLPGLGPLRGGEDAAVVDSVQHVGGDPVREALGVGTGQLEPQFTHGRGVVPTGKPEPEVVEDVALDG